MADAKCSFKDLSDKPAHCAKDTTLKFSDKYEFEDENFLL